MRRLLIFLLLIAVGFGLLYLAMGEDPLFPTPTQPEPKTVNKKPRITTPLVSVDREGHNIQISVGKAVDFKSSRNRILPDGRKVKILRYWLKSIKATPRKGGHYNLSKARIIFYEDTYPSRQILIVHAKNMVIETFSGAQGFRPKENQRMLLHGVTMRSGTALRDGEFKLTTARLVANIQSDGISFSTPTPGLAYQIQGRLSHGNFTLKGKGIESVLPPLARDEKEADHTPPPPQVLRFKGLTDNHGTWRGSADPRDREREPLSFNFSCRGPLVIERLGEMAVPIVTMERGVRVKRLAAKGKGFIRTESLALGLHTGPGPRAKEQPAGGIRWLRARGPRTTFGSDLGEIRAREFHANFHPSGHLQVMRITGIQKLFGNRDGNRFEAKDFGSARIVGFMGRPIPGAPFCPVLARSGGLPGHLVILEGSGEIQLPEKRGRTSTVKAARGARLLFNREGKLMRLTGHGPCRADTPRFTADSDDGFLLVSPVFDRGRRTIKLGPPAGRPPVEFTLHRKETKKNREPLFLQGVGSLVQHITLSEKGSGARPERIRIEAIARGHRPYMRFSGNAGTSKLKIDHIRRIDFERTEAKTEIRTTPQPGGQLRIHLEERDLTVWGEKLDITYDNLLNRGVARCLGGPGSPALVVTRLEEKRPDPQRSKGAKPYVRMLTPTLEINFSQARDRDKEPILKALDGFRMRSRGRDLLSLAGMGGKVRAPEPSLALVPELISSAPGDLLLVSGRELHLEREPGQQTRIVSMYYDVNLKAWHDGTLIRARGNRLWTAPQKSHLVLIGEPASIGLTEPTGARRNLTVVSEVLELSRLNGEMTLVAGLLSSGIGGQVMIESERDFFGRDQTKGTFIRAACGTPIHITRDRMVFTGITTVSQAVRDGKGEFQNLSKSPTLLCGRLECRSGPEAKGAFEEILALRGFKLNYLDRNRSALMGQGRSLRFKTSTGVMEMQGNDQPCQIALGEMAVRGSSILFNIYNYSWEVRRISSNRVVPADHRKGSGKAENH